MLFHKKIFILQKKISSYKIKNIRKISRSTHFGCNNFVNQIWKNIHGKEWRYSRMMKNSWWFTGKHIQEASMKWSLEVHSIDSIYYICSSIGYRLNTNTHATTRTKSKKKRNLFVAILSIQFDVNVQKAPVLNLLNEKLSRSR